MRRMTIMIALSMIVLLLLTGVSVGGWITCDYSTTLEETPDFGCFCDWYETDLCAGDGYKYYVYSCDGDCPACEGSCHWKKEGIGAVINRLYPVCQDIYGGPTCVDDEECEHVSWHTTWTLDPLCLCW